MADGRIPFARVVCDGQELALVREVLDSGWLTTAGKALAFERQFAEAVGAPYACAVTSCTAALHLALEAVGVRRGDKVLVPTWTFTATAEVVRYLGGDPVFLDVEYGTNLLTPETVATALERHPDAKALMVVHFGGQPAVLTRSDQRGILDLCHARGVRVIEDAAHAFPTRWEGRLIGNFSDFTCFSFYANKTITTGEGGMLTTADEALYRRSKVMRLHGIDRDVWNRFTSDKPSWEYDVIAPGYKYNMPDVNAAIGLAQLARAEEFRRGRQRCAEFYLQHLAGVPGLDLPVVRVPMPDHAWHLFPIVLTPEANVGRNQFIERLAEEGIGTSVHYKPLHRLKYYRERYALRPEDFPNAERIWQGCVSLPIYPTLRDDELTRVVEVIRRVLASAGGAGKAASAAPLATQPDSATSSVGSPTTSAPAPPAAPKSIRLSIPHLGSAEMPHVEQAFRTNWMSTTGPNLVALEQRFSAMTGQSAVALSSGTAAIHLGLRLLGVGPGDEVVSPTLTFVASCNPITYLGAKPVFIDSERRSWNLDPQLLAEFLAARAQANRLPRAVVVVHLFGQCADLDPILATCRQYNVPVLEDAAEALGATYRGRLAGTFGDVGVFSLNGNKVITATSGGVLVSANAAWIEHARFWSNQACDANPLNNYLHTELGYNYRMSNVLAGIGLGQLDVLELRVQQRRAVAFRYRDAFADLPGLEFMPQAPYGLHTNWLSCFLVDEAKFGGSAADLIRHLAAAAIESRPVWKPMHTQPLYAGFECVGGAVAEDLNRRGICLPSSSCLTLEEQQFVIERVRERGGRT